MWCQHPKCILNSDMKNVSLPENVRHRFVGHLIKCAKNLMTQTSEDMSINVKVTFKKRGRPPKASKTHRDLKIIKKKRYRPPSTTSFTLRKRQQELLELQKQLKLNPDYSTPLTKVEFLQCFSLVPKQYNFPDVLDEQAASTPINHNARHNSRNFVSKLLHNLPISSDLVQKTARQDIHLKNNEFQMRRLEKNEQHVNKCAPSLIDKNWEIDYGNQCDEIEQDLRNYKMPKRQNYQQSANEMLKLCKPVVVNLKRMSLDNICDKKLDKGKQLVVNISAKEQKLCDRKMKSRKTL